ncbi:hypothetical protein EJD97_009514 [Solanum chilense]|uniref:DUF4283 domain-containing protein n=1 Tax=Solanum chilense TaxID=4083 RepID=A0A6N2AGS9_SOLCI|nr:hypothetical protein EJD97_009514 [Solanum chilense]
MARGRGRGRGRGRKMAIMNDVSSTETSCDAEIAKYTNVARKLSLDPLRDEEEEQEKSDLKGFEDANNTGGNGTVTRNLVEKKSGEEDNMNEKEQEKINEPWVNMFKNNRVASNGMQLTYFPPQVVNGQTMVQLEKTEVQEEEQKWKCALIAYVVGECPGYNTMKRYIMMNWSSVSRPEVYLHEDGYYLIKFQTISDMNEILFSGPYTVNNRPIILKQWCPDFDLGNEFLTEIPLWVNFPKLPLNCWGVGSLSRIASAIGVPLFKIAVVDPNGKTFMQDVELEWRPQYCDKCQKIGHVCRKEQEAKEEVPKRKRPGKKVTQAWQYKGPITQEKVEEQRQEINIRSQDEQQEKEQEIVQQENQQTPKNGSQISVEGQLDLSLANFPMLKAIPTRNGFESLMHNKMASLSVDRGGVPKTC